MNPGQREALRWRLKQLGEAWETRLRSEWLAGRAACQIARDYGLEPATVEALIPRQMPKRKPE